MSSDPPRRWDTPVFRRVRAAVVLLLALAATGGYASFLGHTYPVKEWLFWKVGMFWGWGLLLSLACVSSGHLALSRLFRVTDRPTLETVVESAALGLAIFVLGMYAGGFLHLFNAVFAALLPVAMLAAGARPLVRFLRERHAAWEAEIRAREPSPAPLGATLERGLATAAAVFGVVGAVVVYLGNFTPDSINFDSTWCHFPIAADYVRAGRIVPFTGDYARTVPHLASLVHTWAFLVPGFGSTTTAEPLHWMMALHLEFFFFLWTLAGVAAMARWLLDEPGKTRAPPRGTWAAFFLFPAIFVYDNNLGGAADHYLAFFAPPFFLAAARAMERFDARKCALAGVFAAGAVLTKYQAMYLLFGVGLVLGGRWLALAARRLRLQWRARKGITAPLAGEAPPSWRELVVGPLALVAALVAVSSPHFLKNCAFYGNPIYPFAQDIFKTSHPTVPRADYLFEWLFKDYSWRPHGTFFENLRDALKLCLTFSFDPHYSFTKNVPNTGSLFTLGLLFIPLLRARRRVALGAVASLGCVLLWGMTFRIDRNLQTFMPLLAATTAAMIVSAWELGWIARAGVAPLVALQVIWGGDALFYSSHTHVKAAIDLIRSGFDGGRDNRYTYRQEYRELGKALPLDAKVVIHDYHPNLGIDRDLFLDTAGQQGLITYDGMRGPRAMFERWRALGMTHLLYLPGRRAPTAQEDVLFNDFLAHYVKKRRNFSGFELADLPAEPPPPDPPYAVVALGVSGYKDGLYPVEAMSTYESLPKHLLRYPPPEVPWPAAPDAQRALLDRAEAVLQNNRTLEPTVKARLDEGFASGATTTHAYTIFYRKRSAAPVQAPSPAAPAHALDLEEP